MISESLERILDCCERFGKVGRLLPYVLATAAAVLVVYSAYKFKSEKDFEYAEPIKHYAVISPENHKTYVMLEQQDPYLSYVEPEPLDLGAVVNARQKPGIIKKVLPRKRKVRGYRRRSRAKKTCMQRTFFRDDHCYPSMGHILPPGHKPKINQETGPGKQENDDRYLFRGSQVVILLPSDHTAVNKKRNARKVGSRKIVKQKKDENIEYYPRVNIPPPVQNQKVKKEIRKKN